MGIYDEIGDTGPTKWTHTTSLYYLIPTDGKGQVMTPAREGLEQWISAWDF